jgi:murein tripeptide amidase MpaA
MATGGFEMDMFSVVIGAKSLKELRELDKFDLDIKRRAAQKVTEEKFIVPGILTREQIEQVKSRGYAVEITADLSQVGKERSVEVSRVDRFVPKEGISVSRELKAAENYLNAQEVETALQALQKEYPQNVSLVELPNKTHMNRTSLAARVQAGSISRRPGVLFTGSMHAREWGGSDACISFLYNLLGSYKNNQDLVWGGKIYANESVKKILETLDIFVFPDVNPDGKEYSQTRDAWWRKNRNPKGAVDINRNFDFLWKSGIGTSSSSNSEVYRGKALLSEPETKNVVYLFDNYPNIGYYLDIHSYSGLFLYPWGDDQSQSTNPDQNFKNQAYDGLRGKIGDIAYKEYMPEDLRARQEALGKRMSAALAAVRGSNYDVQQSVGLYPTSATSDDYAISRHFIDPNKELIYAFTVEFGKEFIPPYPEMIEIIKELGAAMTELCLAASE